MVLSQREMREGTRQLDSLTHKSRLTLEKSSCFCEAGMSHKLLYP